ncbi:hypothetical protein IFM89_020562 [Coptis chinensis]|uniref:CCHC-type domain-containing protein n=1 Tax=Coptis chinensis TaxID=261450 RepID=A0A835ICP0_9MAGN|nr:hypothetical protein IFM89_020562 [Coptis chinensis]
MVDNIDGRPSAGGHTLKVAGASTSTAFGDDDGGGFKEQDRLLPIANVGRIMKQILPPNAKISKEAKETMQECVSEFIGFVTGEASDKCHKEKRKTVNGDDICWAMSTLGFDEYVEPLKRCEIFRSVFNKKQKLERGTDRHWRLLIARSLCSLASVTIIPAALSHIKSAVCWHRTSCRQVELQGSRPSTVLQNLNKVEELEYIMSRAHADIENDTEQERRLQLVPISARQNFSSKSLKGCSYCDHCGNHGRTKATCYKIYRVPCCDQCGKEGHTKETCYKIHGFPPKKIESTSLVASTPSTSESAGFKMTSPPFSQEQYNKLLALLSSVVNCIWKERNFRRFRNIAQDWQEVTSRLINDMGVYLQCQLREVKYSGELKNLLERLGVVEYNVKVPKQCIWGKPQRGINELNTDGSLKDEKGSIGGIIRDSKGILLLAYTEAGGLNSVLFQELKAILGKERAPWKCEDITMSIRELLHLFDNVSFIHVYREANRAADYLVSLAMEDVIEYFVPPLNVDLMNIVEEDKEGLDHNGIMIFTYIGGMVETKDRFYTKSSTQSKSDSMPTVSTTWLQQDFGVFKFTTPLENCVSRVFSTGGTPVQRIYEGAQAYYKLEAYFVVIPGVGDTLFVLLGKYTEEIGYCYKDACNLSPPKQSPSQARDDKSHLYGNLMSLCSMQAATRAISMKT